MEILSVGLLPPFAGGDLEGTELIRCPFLSLAVPIASSRFSQVRESSLPPDQRYQSRADLAYHHQYGDLASVSPRCGAWVSMWNEATDYTVSATSERTTSAHFLEYC